MKKELESILLKISLSPTIDSGDLAKAGNIIVEACCEGLLISRASIWKTTSEGIDCHTLLDDTEDLSHHRLSLARADYPSYFNALDTERTIIANDAESHLATHEFTEGYLRPLRIKSMLDVPIRYMGKMYGIICCESKGDVARVWSDDEISFVSTLAEVYGRAIGANFRVEYENCLLAVNTNLEEVIYERTEELEQIVNDLKAAQANLIESEKMAALGHLVAGIAHEVNTPLGIAITSVSAMSDTVERVSNAITNHSLTQSMLSQSLIDKRVAIDMAMTNLNRAANLVSDFKKIAVDHTHVSIDEFDVVDYTNNIVNTVIDDLELQSISTHLNAPPSLLIKSMPGLIAQVISIILQNVIQHAFRSSPESNQVETVDKEIRITIESASGGCRIFIADTGVGMTEAQLKKVFDPFYTTNRGEGSPGLGLSIAYNIVNQKLKGRLKAESSLGSGTTLILYLPAEI